MASVKELEKRVTATEDELLKLRREVSEVRTLASGASKDAGDYQAALRGHKMSLEALRKTQLQQSELLEGLAETLDARFAELGVTQLEQWTQIQALVGSVTTTLTAMTTTLNAMSEEMQGVRVTQLEQQADVEKIQESSMRHWTELQDVRRTQLKHHAEVKAGLAGIVKVLESRGADTGKAGS